MAADYTYAPAPVLDDSTGDFAIGVAGVLKTADGVSTSPMYDLNGSSITSIVVGSKGAHPGFRADIPNGLLDFGSVLIPSASLEQQQAGLVAVTTADAAAEDATAAVAAADAATVVANDAASAVADAPSTGEVETLIAEAVAAGVADALRVLRYNFASNTWGGKVRPPGAQPVLFVHPQAARPPLNGTIAGGVLAVVPGTDYLLESPTV